MTVKENHDPLVLLSHIPLYRPDGAYCGHLRETGTINRGAGHGYQNTLGKQTTAFLMEVLEPSIVFRCAHSYRINQPDLIWHSGDNRDYCEYLHKGTSFSAEESIPAVTVKSFSPTPQIRRPGFQLLSIISPVDRETTKSLLHRPCLLPDRRLNSFGYMGWTFTMFCILLILNVQRIRRFRLSKPVNHSSVPSRTQIHQTPSSSQDATNDVLSVTQTPHMPLAPKSARNQISPTFRIPVALATPTFRASSRPLTSQGFNDLLMSSPQPTPSIRDDEDFMFPGQYTIHRTVSHVNDEEWMPMERENYLIDSDTSVHGIFNKDPWAFPSPSQFASAPGNISMHHKKPSAWKVIWSWTFVIAGRRRQFIMFRVPRLSVWWAAFRAVLEILRDADQRSLSRRRRGVVASTLIESISIFWPAGVIWLMITCWMF